MINKNDDAPSAWRDLLRRSQAMGFDMPSDARTGGLLRMLAASKPGGRLLELGTGTGLATAWLLDGMDKAARLVSIDNDAAVQAPAREVLGADPRVRFVIGDGLDYIGGQPPGSCDLIFADAMPGKYEGLEAALALLAPGGLYIGDDMLPQPNWPDGHQARVDGLMATLTADCRLAVQGLDWGTGFVIAARRAA